MYFLNESFLNFQNLKDFLISLKSDNINIRDKNAP